MRKTLFIFIVLFSICLLNASQPGRQVTLEEAISYNKVIFDGLLIWKIDIELDK